MNWGYVAGYFDGEGCVGRYSQKRNRKHFVCHLSWYNSHRESLEAIQAFLGCGRVIESSGSDITTKQVYLLRLSKRSEMLHAINGMMPYLIIKREKAQRLREHLETIKDASPNVGKVAAVSTEQLIEWYHGEGKTFVQIAELLGVCQRSIQQAFVARGIKARPNAAHFKGVSKSPETVERMRAASRKRWQDPEYREVMINTLKNARASKRTKGR